ncbi:MAG: hypothetical protein D6820_04275 [Lentisphaerae bacterium]|nr:MAG: hypothetical protein D6820_04275 [Lentisphaerota bacterium]
MKKNLSRFNGQSPCFEVELCLDVLRHGMLLALRKMCATFRPPFQSCFDKTRTGGLIHRQNKLYMYHMQILAAGRLCR